MSYEEGATCQGTYAKERDEAAKVYEDESVPDSGLPICLSEGFGQGFKAGADWGKEWWGRAIESWRKESELDQEFLKEEKQRSQILTEAIEKVLKNDHPNADWEPDILWKALREYNSKVTVTETELDPT